MRACALEGKTRLMLVWHSAQVLLPTKLAPGMLCNASTVAGVVEQEFSRSNPQTGIAASRLSRSFIF
jgi:hypothetical protein